MGWVGQCAGRGEWRGACSKCLKHGIGSCPCMLGMYTNYTACYISYTCTHTLTHSQTHTDTCTQTLSRSMSQISLPGAKDFQFLLIWKRVNKFHAPGGTKPNQKLPMPLYVGFAVCLYVCVCAACICCSPVLIPPSRTITVK